MVHDDINRGGGALKAMVPVPECLKDGKEFLIVGVWSSQGLGVVGDWTNLSISASDRQDASDGVVRGIHFHDDRGVRNEMGKDGRSGEGMLESIEGMLTVLGEVPRYDVRFAQILFTLNWHAQYEYVRPKWQVCLDKTVTCPSKTTACLNKTAVCPNKTAICPNILDSNNYNP